MKTGASTRSEAAAHSSEGSEPSRSRRDREPTGSASAWIRHAAETFERSDGKFAGHTLRNDSVSPTLRVELAQSLADLQSALVVGIPHFPPAVQAKLGEVRHEVQRGRTALNGITNTDTLLTLHRLYSSRATYLAAFMKSTDRAIAAGYQLPADRSQILGTAQQVHI